MYIFFISIITVTIISFCFFKKRFWEYRYLILLIIGGVSLVATLTTNFAMRKKLGTKAEIVWKRPLYRFYLPDSLLKDDLKAPVIKEWEFLGDHKIEEFYKDSTHKQVPTCFVIYFVKGEKYVGYFKYKNKRDNYKFKDIHIAPCSNKDTIAYMCKKNLKYNVSGSWLTGFSFPRISSEIVMYVPVKYYNTIPDSMINKPQF